VKIEQQVIDLWDQTMDEDLCDSENISFETFLGAQYARRVLSKQCKLTADGKEVVEAARDALIELLGDTESDEDDE
jgi:hypothetical protein